MPQKSAYSLRKPIFKVYAVRNQGKYLPLCVLKNTHFQDYSFVSVFDFFCLIFIIFIFFPTLNLSFHIWIRLPDGSEMVVIKRFAQTTFRTALMSHIWKLFHRGTTLGFLSDWYFYVNKSTVGVGLELCNLEQYRNTYQDAFVWWEVWWYK